MERKRFMNGDLTSKKNISLRVEDENDHEQIVKLCRALSVPERVTILKSILSSSKNLSQLSEELGIPISSMSRHIAVLEEAGIVYYSFHPTKKGHSKFCTQAIMEFMIDLDTQKEDPVPPKYTVEMPLGMFSHCHIKAPCGINSAEKTIGGFDNPKVFFYPERSTAESLWFDSGFISYNFPADFLTKSNFEEISFSFEVCSETLYYNNNWPSDITVRINNVEVLTFTSPGDFGGRRGKYTPAYWPISSTQFGLLKTVRVNQKGVWLDDELISEEIKLDDLNIYGGNAIRFDIGVKEDAKHRGGINLFGRNFGNYPQSIIMSLK